MTTVTEIPVLNQAALDRVAGEEPGPLLLLLGDG
jgi:hypothetical protein